MKFNKFEKSIIVSLIALIAIAGLLILGKIGVSKQRNSRMLKQIAEISALTDRNVLVKGDSYFDEKENARKLNLNKTDLKSLMEVPKISKSDAKKIFAFIEKKGNISDLRELLQIKGFTRKKVYRLERYVTAKGGHGGRNAWGNKLNLNFATFKEVSELPGIGKAMAKKIINFRNKNGAFYSLDDLREIPGLSDSTVKKFIDLVEVR